MKTINISLILLFLLLQSLVVFSLHDDEDHIIIFDILIKYSYSSNETIS